MFTIAGPVIVYGVSASMVDGIIYWITTLFKGCFIPPLQMLLYIIIREENIRDKKQVRWCYFLRRSEFALGSLSSWPLLETQFERAPMSMPEI